MSMPKGDESTREFFRSLLPDDDRVTVRPMFGNLAGFVQENMFSGIFGASVFVRLPEGAREELLALPCTAAFAPNGWTAATACQSSIRVSSVRVRTT